jgi:hypothetical protein
VTAVTDHVELLDEIMPELLRAELELAVRRRLANARNATPHIFDTGDRDVAAVAEIMRRADTMAEQLEKERDHARELLGEVLAVLIQGGQGDSFVRREAIRLLDGRGVEVTR